LGGGAIGNLAPPPKTAYDAPSAGGPVARPCLGGGAI